MCCELTAGAGAIPVKSSYNNARPFRGVSKWYLAGYVAMFEWANNLKHVTDKFLEILLREL